MTAGGAALVASNLKSLGAEVTERYGSNGTKTRIFADRTLICRIDHDRKSVIKPDDYSKEIEAHAEEAEAIVVGDYAKGAMSEAICHGLAKYRNKVFVDTKQSPSLYAGAFAIFPNQHEHLSLAGNLFQHTVRKLGPGGCSLDGLRVPAEPQQVYDVTGAGDCFLAAFVWSFLKTGDLMQAARVANKAGGISVRHLGTYIVKPGDLS